MVAAQSGDQMAYQKLLHAAIPRIQTYFRSRVAAVEQGLDLTQEVLLRLHAFRHTYTPDRPFLAWLFTICRNTLIDAARYAKRRPLGIKDNSVLEGLAIQESDPAGRLLLEEALAQLSDDQRAILLLVKRDGLSLQEAAEKLGITEANAKVRVHRGMLVIRAWLSG